MTITVVGRLVDSEGRGLKKDFTGVPAETFTSPSGLYRKAQPSDIPLYFGHDVSWRIGTVRYLERSREELRMVAVINDVDPPGRPGDRYDRRAAGDLGDVLAENDPLYLSPGFTGALTESGEFIGSVLRECSLTQKPGAVHRGPPVSWGRKDVATDRMVPSNFNLHWMDTWRRAHEHLAARRYKRSASELTIVDLDELPFDQLMVSDPPEAKRQLVEMMESHKANHKATTETTVHRRAAPRQPGWLVEGRPVSARSSAALDELIQFVEWGELSMAEFGEMARRAARA